MKIAIASDHAGYSEKEEVKKMLQSLGYEVADCGTESGESVDYPDFAARAAEKVSKGECEMSVMLCGTGIGMAMAANKFSGVRAAVCYSEFSTEMARRHNNANVLCLGARSLSMDQIRRYVDIFLKTPFEGGRHLRRINKIHELEHK
jgi:ribose 5-phosphate isomerase B